MVVTWTPPFRHDLTPDVNYSRLTPAYAVTVKGTSRGARALVFASSDYFDPKTGLSEIFGNPFAGFATNSFSEAVRDLP